HWVSARTCGNGAELGITALGIPALCIVFFLSHEGGPLMFRPMFSMKAARSFLGQQWYRECLPVQKQVPLCVEKLEDRTPLSAFSSTGALGNLIPAHEVAFNTANGTYQVDYSSWRAGGQLSADTGHSVMLYNFTTIKLRSGISVTASGSRALGLLGTSGIVI